MKSQKIDWKSILSSSPPDDLLQLERFCDIVPDYLRTLAIEIGSYEGASTALLLQYFDTVIAIDPWGEHDVKDGEKIATFTKGTEGTNIHFINFNKNMHRLNLNDRLIRIVGTVEALKRLPILDAGLVFVDDGHTYTDCTRDIDVSMRHLNVDGLLVCHDYYNQTGGPCGSYIGVTGAVNKAISEYDLEVLHHSGGIIGLKRKLINLRGSL